MSIKGGGGVPCILWVLKGVGQGVDAGFIDQCIPLNKQKLETYNSLILLFDKRLRLTMCHFH